MITPCVSIVNFGIGGFEGPPALLDPLIRHARRIDEIMYPALEVSTYPQHGCLVYGFSRHVLTALGIRIASPRISVPQGYLVGFCFATMVFGITILALAFGRASGR